MQNDSCPRGCMLRPGVHPDVSYDVIPLWRRPGVIHCDCGRNYRLKTLLGLMPAGAPLQEFSPLQRALDAMMQENGKLYGRKAARLMHGGENSLNGHPPEQQEWINLEDSEVAEYLRSGSGWTIETALRVVHPSPELVAAFEKRLDGFRDMEALRAQLVRGRPKEPRKRHRACSIVRDVLREGFDQEEIAFYVGVTDRTMRRIKSE